MGTQSRPKISWMLSTVRWKSERSRSSLLMKKACGRWNSSRERVDLFGLHLHAGDAIDHDERGIGRQQGCARVLDEDVEAGSIEEIDLGLLPLGDSDSGGDGEFTLDFFFVEVRDRVPFVRPGQTVDSPGCIEKGGREHRFSAMPVAHDTDIANVLAFVDFQVAWPPLPGLIYITTRFQARLRVQCGARHDIGHGYTPMNTGKRIMAGFLCICCFCS